MRPWMDTGGRMNIYAASVALLWTTAVRAVTSPRDPPRSVGCAKRWRGKMRPVDMRPAPRRLRP